MSNKNTPESAFPSTFKSLSPEEAQVHRWGMTLRDYFAAKVIQGICASGPGHEWSNSRLAVEAYEMADAMLKARDA
jgi:hypothetical protein